MSHAFIYQSALSDGKVLAPAKSMAEMGDVPLSVEILEAVVVH